MRQTYKLNINFMALMLSVYGTPVDGSEERATTMILTSVSITC